jgi:hypothetical protein
MECDGPRCELDTCGGGCTILCARGRSCTIGLCEGDTGGCYIGSSGEGTAPATLLITDCPGGNCSLECAPGDTCTIGTCTGGNCTIVCPEGATCNCAPSGCTLVEPV